MAARTWTAEQRAAVGELTRERFTGRKQTEEHIAKRFANRVPYNKGLPSLNRLPHKEVIARLRALFGKTYDLSRVVHDGSSKLELICSEHGSFFKLPTDILNNKRCLGCPKCSSNRLSPKEHLSQLANLYPDMDFRKSAYTNALSKLDFKCKRHNLTLSARPNRLRNAAKEGKGWTPCAVCRREALDAKMYASKLAQYPSSKAGYLCYRQEVRRHTSFWFKQSSKGYERTRDFHLDHMFSIKDGWLQGVAPEIVGHKVNLRMLPGTLNRQKSHHSSITKKELLVAYRNFKRNSK